MLEAGDPIAVRAELLTVARKTPEYAEILQKAYRPRNIYSPGVPTVGGGPADNTCNTTNSNRMKHTCNSSMEHNTCNPLDPTTSGAYSREYRCSHVAGDTISVEESHKNDKNIKNLSN